MLLRICNRRILPKPYFQQQRRERSGRGYVIEIDLQGDGVKKVEEIIHRMDVLKSTPEWLPFLPGSSFWVPPPTSPSRDTLSQAESLSLTTLQGWPSSHFFQDAKVTEEVDVVVELRLVEAEVEAETEAEVEVEGNAAAAVGETQVLTHSGKTSKSENEEG